MNLQMKVIEGDFCLTDADSGEYWRLFSGSCYENLSGCPIHIKSTSTPLSVLDIYSAFFLKLLGGPASGSMPPWLLIGSHIVRELMARNQKFYALAAGRELDGMADALSELVHSFREDSGILLAEPENRAGEGRRAPCPSLKEVLPIIGEGTLSCLILEAELLQHEDEGFFADLIWKVSEGGSLVIYGEAQDAFLMEHPFLQDFSGQEFAGSLVAEGRVDAGLLGKVRVYTESARRSAERNGIVSKFKELLPLLEELLGADEEKEAASCAERAVRALTELERLVAGYYPRLRDLDLKWDTNRFKEAAVRLLLAWEDTQKDAVLTEQETLSEIWRAYEKAFYREFGYFEERGDRKQ